MEGVDCDVIVVGAGTAGCYLAQQLARRGLDVRVVEQNRHTKADSGVVSNRFFEYVPDRSLIKARIKAMDLIGPSGAKVNIRSTKPFAFLLDRERLGKKMRERVRSRVVSARFLGFVAHRGWLDVRAQEADSHRETSYSCRVLVGADGAMSAVRTALGIRPPNLTWGVMARLDRPFSKGRCVAVHFDKQYSPDGFSWTIPQNSELGLLSSVKPMDCFQRFAHAVSGGENDAEGNVWKGHRADLHSHVVGAPIPVGTCRTHADRTILVGDAAGQTKPLTGGGIVWGLRCADIAARAVEYAFDAGRYDAFFWKTEYERRWQAAIGRELRRQLAVRKLYARLGNAQIDGIFNAIKPQLERASEFDYDALSGLIARLPKISLARVLAPALLRLA